MFAHVGSEEKAGVCLIHGIAFRAGKIYKVFAELQHLCATGLFACFISQMGRRYGSARSHGVDADIGIDQTHSYVFGQCVDSAFRGGIGCPAERTVSIDGRNVDDTAFVFGQEYFQCFPDKTEWSEHIGLIYMLQPFVIRFVDHFLFADGRIVDDNIKIAVNSQSSPDYIFNVFQIFIVRYHAGNFQSLFFQPVDRCL